MADEFMKGFALLMVCGLLWMVLAGWYNTAGFEEAQLFAETSGAGTVYDQIGYALREGFFYAAILGPLTFWVLIPISRRMRA
ncbi:DUF7314 family protein [Halomarina rubra]|uniref:DUF7314 domain-containing protein n=1 Tax=Halomarina rubra TaxID=2071873 RepID=A0ABD6ARB6_9EURY|nr:hypothetical protein [Halomarina rubra]